MPEIKFGKKYIALDRSHTIVPREVITDLSTGEGTEKILCCDHKLRNVAYTKTQILNGFKLFEELYPSVDVGSYYRTGNEVHHVFSAASYHGNLERVSVSSAKGIIALTAEQFYANYTKFDNRPGDVWVSSNEKRFIVHDHDNSDIIFYEVGSDTKHRLPKYRFFQLFKLEVTNEDRFRQFFNLEA